MKVSSLFTMITDGNDVLDFFDGVATTDQLVSRLDRLKRQGTDPLLDCLYALRSSIASALNDTLEMSPEPRDPDVDDNLGESLDDEELENLTSDSASEKQNLTEPPPPEVEKS
jgi:hypothetical protein